MCGAVVAWRNGEPTLTVSGSKAEEVDAVTRSLAGVLQPPRIQKPEDDQAHKNWARTKAAWALAIGLTTIIGGICAVIALFVH
jgi:hypothetical protein